MDKTGRIKTRIDDSHAPPGILYLISLLQLINYIILYTINKKNYTLINDVPTNQLII